MSAYFISEHPHGVPVPRETGAPNFVRLSSAKICTMCEEPKGVEGVLARVKQGPFLSAPYSDKTPYRRLLFCFR